MLAIFSSMLVGCRVNWYRGTKKPWKVGIKGDNHLKAPSEENESDPVREVRLQRCHRPAERCKVDITELHQRLKRLLRET